MTRMRELLMGGRTYTIPTLRWGWPPLVVAEPCVLPNLEEMQRSLTRYCLTHLYSVEKLI